MTLGGKPNFTYCQTFRQCLQVDILSESPFTLSTIGIMLHKTRQPSSVDPLHQQTRVTKVSWFVNKTDHSTCVSSLTSNVLTATPAFLNARRQNPAPQQYAPPFLCAVSQSPRFQPSPHMNSASTVPIQLALHRRSSCLRIYAGNVE